MFRYVVLGLLQDGEPRHGYALMKKYGDRVGEHVSTRNFYRELQRLVEEGLARNVDRAEEADPRQAPYVITDSGRDTFYRWFVDVAHATAGSSHDDGISERLAFLADVPSDKAREMLDRLQDDLWIHAKSLERSRDRAVATRAQANTHEFPVYGIILARRIRQVTADVAFLNELREAYGAWVERRKDPAPTRSAASAREVSRPRSDLKRQRS